MNKTTIIMTLIFTLLIRGNFAKAPFSDEYAEETTNAEYLLLVRNSTWVRRGDFPEDTYSFIGNGIESFEEGAKIYESFNSEYALNTGNFDIQAYLEHDGRILPTYESYIDFYNELKDDYMNFFNMRKVVAISKDGKLVVCSSLPSRSENIRENGLYTWTNQYDVFEDDKIVYTFFDNDPFNVFNSDYFISNGFIDAERAKKSMMNSLNSPDNKFLAYSGPQLGDDDKGSEDIQEGYFIKNLENGETLYYPASASNYEMICWVEKDKIMGK